MEFGVCTNFAATAEDPVGMGLIPLIAEAGFDYAELPMCEVASLSEAHFEKLQQILNTSGLSVPVACNLFPDNMLLRGEAADPKAIAAYLEHALDRASRLGIQKIIFASVSAWNTSGNPREARSEIVSLVRSVMVPLLQEHHIRILIEGIRKQVCNVVNTLPEAARIALDVNHPSCGYMADLYHMLSNEEPEVHLARWVREVGHVHIAEQGRKLPAETVSPELTRLLLRLARGAYDGQISFEVCAPLAAAQLQAAKENIRQLLA